MLNSRRLVSLALSCLCALSTVAAHALSVAPVTQVTPAAAGPITFPSTAVGGGSNTVAVSLLINQSGTLTITAPSSANGHVEFTVGTVSGTGCTTDGVTTVVAATTCNFNVTFTPYYPGQRSVPLAVTLGGQVYTFGLTGYATGPLARLDPTYLATLTGAAGTTSTTASPDNVPYGSGILYQEYGVYADSSNNVYIADQGHNRIRLVYQSANPQLACMIIMESPTTFGLSSSATSCAGATSQPTVGDIYTIAGTGTTTVANNAGGVAATSVGVETIGVTVDTNGNVYIFDSHDFVRVVYQGGANIACLIQIENPTLFGMTAGVTSCATATSQPVPGYLYNLAGNGTAGYTGDGGIATSGELYSPTDGFVDAMGDVFFTTFNGSTSALTTANGHIRVIYNGGTAAAQLISVENSGITPVIGDIYTVGGGPAATVFGGDGTLATSSTAGILTSYALKGDQYGNLYFTDKTYSTGVPLASTRVRVIYNGTVANPNPLANLIYLENQSGTVSGLNLANAAAVQPGYIYTIAGSKGSLIASGAPYGTAAPITAFSVTSNVATITTALGATPGLIVGQPVTISGLSIGTYLNNAMPNEWIITSVSSTGFTFNVTQANVATTTDSGAWAVQPLDGVLASASYFIGGYGLVLDPAGDIIVSDRFGYTVRRISAATGIISTIGGQGVNTQTIVSGFAIGSGAGRFWSPWGLAVDSAGGFYVGDEAANRVRILEASDSSTVPMTVPASATNVNSGVVGYIETNVGTPGSTLTITTDNAGGYPFGYLGPVPSTSFPGINQCQATSTLVTTSITSNVPLSAGSSCQLGVAMDATSAGTFTAGATTTDNSLNVTGNVHTMYLTGTVSGVMTTLTSNPVAPYAGSPTQLIATLVNGSTPVTCGTVSFSITGGTSLGSATLDPVLGTATITTSLLVAPTTSITTVYAGSTTGASCSNALFTPSTSVTVLTVSAKPVPVVTITAAPTAINAGGSTLLTATVTATSGTPTGSVTITTKIGTGTATTVCSTTTLANTGIFTCSPTTLVQGTNVISASYGGDNNFAGASTTTSATVVVTGLPTTTTLTVLPVSANLNQTVTMTATVSGLQTSPALSGGSVTFKDTFTPTTGTGATLTYGPVAVNTTTNQAVYTSSTLAAGTHVIVATFANDSYYATSVSVSSGVTVVAPGFYVTLVSANGTAVPVTTPATTYAGIAVQQGLNGLVTFSIQSVGGYTGTVTPLCDLNGTSVSGLPIAPLPATMGCLYAPANFVFTSNTTSTETVAITTQKLIAANRTANPILAVLLLPGAGLALFSLRRRSALKTWQRLALFCLIFIGGAMAVGGLSGCGNGVSLTPKNSYLVPITFSDGTTTVPFMITVTVIGN